MDAKGIEGMSFDYINSELQKGARFIEFEYCFSIIFMSFKQRSATYFIKAGESPLRKSAGYTLISMLFGWWGIPWGVFYTLAALATNLRGGVNVTDYVINTWNGVDPVFAELTRKDLQESLYVFDILEVESAYQDWFDEMQHSMGQGPTEQQVYEWMLNEGSDRQKTVARLILDYKSILNPLAISVALKVASATLVE